jgi:hypothetical protein
MGKLAEAYVEITSKTDKLDAGLAATEDKFKASMGRIEAMLMTGVVTAAGASIVTAFQKAIDKGADLTETMSKVKEVFGGSTAKIMTMADDMAKRFGSVRGVTLDAAANLGLVAQGAGLTAAQSAVLAERLTRLADDAASFYNVPLDVALEKIRSGLVGEAEPLRAFGVLLSEANIKAAALQEGIIPVNRELTEQEKVLARVTVITQGLAKAQGDHERTLGSYKNQLKLVTGELENWMAAMGQPLSGAAALLMKRGREVQEKAAPWEYAFPLALAYRFAAGSRDMQREADVNAGVVTGLSLPAPAETPMQKFIRERIAYDARLRREDWEKKKFEGIGPGGSPFGMFGMLGMELSEGAMWKALDKKDRELRDRPWSGGHVTDMSSFLKNAQEHISTDLDKTAKEHLAETKKVRELLTKIASARVGFPEKGTIVKGRES